MRVCGIIAEYNPFHLGHMHHIVQTRQSIADDCAVVCVMSGNFVQRGDFAVFDKFSRAKAAVSVENAADLVIELPLPYALSGAAGFAAAGVALLDACGVVDTLSFGSESGELEPLLQLAHYMGTPAFDAAVADEIQSGVTYAVARQRVCERALGGVATHLASPNNTLGVEYLSALLLTKSAMTPLTVQRKGAAHDGVLTADGGIASASAVRRCLAEGDSTALDNLPQASAAVCREEMMRGAGPVLADRVDTMLMSALRRMSADDYAKLPDISEGLEYRLATAVAEATGFAQAIDLAKTKRYTHARLRRILMCGFVGVTADLASLTPPYLRVLAMNSRGREVLRRMKDSATLPIITKPTEVHGMSYAARRMFDAERLAGDLYALARPNAGLHVAGEDFRRSPYISLR